MNWAHLLLVGAGLLAVAEAEDREPPIKQLPPGSEVFYGFTEEQLAQLHGTAPTALPRFLVSKEARKVLAPGSEVFYGYSEEQLKELQQAMKKEMEANKQSDSSRSHQELPIKELAPGSETFYGYTEEQLAQLQLQQAMASGAHENPHPRQPQYPHSPRSGTQEHPIKVLAPGSETFYGYSEEQLKELQQTMKKEMEANKQSDSPRSEVHELPIKELAPGSETFYGYSEEQLAQLQLQQAMASGAHENPHPRQPQYPHSPRSEVQELPIKVLAPGSETFYGYSEEQLAQMQLQQAMASGAHENPHPRQPQYPKKPHPVPSAVPGQGEVMQVPVLLLQLARRRRAALEGVEDSSPELERPQQWRRAVKTAKAKDERTMEKEPEVVDESEPEQQQLLNWLQAEMSSMRTTETPFIMMG